MDALVRDRISSSKKTFKKWKENIPTDAPISIVKAMLDRYFEGEWRQNGTSHIVVESERLEGFESEKQYCQFSIPVKQGKRVINRYLKKLVDDIEYIETTGE